MKYHLTLLLKKSMLLSVLFTFPIFSETMRIMPVGDSITRGYPYDSGYRKYVWYRLKDAQYDINFVGTQNHGYSINPPFDFNHEGYNYAKTYDIAEIIYGLLEDNQPDIILLHIGSNDVSPTQGVNSSSIAGLQNILRQIDYYERDYSHPIRVILASIINRKVYHQTVRDYNRNLRAMARARIANGDKITLIDMEYGAGLNASDFNDPTHPNYSGYYKMSNVWVSALKSILPPPTPTQPTNVTTSSITSNTVTLSWGDTSSNELGFKIYEGSTLIATLPANTTSYTLRNLDSHTTYVYTVKSYNANGESTASTITFSTKDDYAWLIAVNHIILN